MTQAKLKNIVREMVNAGESDSTIGKFIEEYKKRNTEGKKNGSTKRASVGPSLARKNMAYPSVNGFLDSPIKHSNTGTDHDSLTTLSHVAAHSKGGEYYADKVQFPEVEEAINKSITDQDIKTIDARRKKEDIYRQKNSNQKLNQDLENAKKIGEIETNDGIVSEFDALMSSTIKKQKNLHRYVSLELMGYVEHIYADDPVKKAEYKRMLKTKRYGKIINELQTYDFDLESVSKLKALYTNKELYDEIIKNLKKLEKNHNSLYPYLKRKSSKQKEKDKLEKQQDIELTKPKDDYTLDIDNYTFWKDIVQNNTKTSKQQEMLISQGHVAFGKVLGVDHPKNITRKKHNGTYKWFNIKTGTYYNADSILAKHLDKYGLPTEQQMIQWGSLEGGEEYRDKQKPKSVQDLLSGQNEMFNLRDVYYENKKLKDAIIQKNEIFGDVKDISFTDENKTIIDSQFYDEGLDQVVPVFSAIANKAYEGGDGVFLVDGIEYKRTDLRDTFTTISGKEKVGKTKTILQTKSSDGEWVEINPNEHLHIQLSMLPRYTIEGKDGVEYEFTAVKGDIKGDVYKQIYKRKKGEKHWSKYNDEIEGIEYYEDKEAWDEDSPTQTQYEFSLTRQGRATHDDAIVTENILDAITEGVSSPDFTGFNIQSLSSLAKTMHNYIVASSHSSIIESYHDEIDQEALKNIKEKIDEQEKEDDRNIEKSKLRTNKYLEKAQKDDFCKEYDLNIVRDDWTFDPDKGEFFHKELKNESGDPTSLSDHMRHLSGKTKLTGDDYKSYKNIESNLLKAYYNNLGVKDARMYISPDNVDLLVEYNHLRERFYEDDDYDNELYTDRNYIYIVNGFHTHDNETLEKVNENSVEEIIKHLIKGELTVNVLQDDGRKTFIDDLEAPIIGDDGEQLMIDGEPVYEKIEKKVTLLDPKNNREDRKFLHKLLNAKVLDVSGRETSIKRSYTPMELRFEIGKYLKEKGIEERYSEFDHELIRSLSSGDGEMDWNDVRDDEEFKDKIDNDPILGQIIKISDRQYQEQKFSEYCENKGKSKAYKEGATFYGKTKTQKASIKGYREDVKTAKEAEASMDIKLDALESTFEDYQTRYIQMTDKDGEFSKEIELGQEKITSMYNEFNRLAKEGKKLDGTYYASMEEFEEEVAKLEKMKTDFKASVDEKVKEREDLIDAMIEVSENMQVLGDMDFAFSNARDTYASFLDSAKKKQGIISGAAARVQTSFANLSNNINQFTFEISNDLLDYAGIVDSEEYKACVDGYNETIKDFNENVMSDVVESRDFSDIGADGGYVFDTIKYMTDIAAENSAVTLVAICTGNPYAAFGLGYVSGAGSKYREMRDYADLHGITYTPMQFHLTANAFGLAEGATELITFGLSQKLLKKVGGDQYLKRGFSGQYTSRFLASSIIIEPGTEGLSEGVNQLVGNILDREALGRSDVGYFDDVPMAIINGTMASQIMYTTPAIGIDLVKTFSSKDFNQKIGENSERLKQIKLLLAKKDLDANVRKKLEKECWEINNENVKIISKEVGRFDNLKDSEKQEIFDIERQRYETRKEMQDIQDSNLTQEEKNIELKKLSEKTHTLYSRKNEILEPYLTKEERVAKEKEFKKDVEKTRKQAEYLFGNAVEAYEATTPEEAAELMEINLNERKIAAMEEIQKTPRNSKKYRELKFEIDQVNAGLAQIENIQNNPNQESLAGGAFGAFGFITEPDQSGKRRLIINKKNALRAGFATTGQHELLHAVLRETINNNPEIQVELGSALGEYLSRIDTGKLKDSEFVQRIRAYQDAPANVQAEEMLALLSEAMTREDLGFNEGAITKVKDSYRRILQRIGYKNIEFNTGQDVFNFIKDYNKFIQSGKGNIAIKRMAEKGAKGKLVLEGKSFKEQQEMFSKQTVLQGLYEKFAGDKGTLVREGLSKKADGTSTTNLFESELGDALGPIVEAITKRLFDPIPVSERNNLTRDEFKQALIATASTLIQNEFDASKQTLDKFISNRLNFRANRLAKDLGVKQVFTEQIDDKRDLTAPEDIVTEEAIVGKTLEDMLVKVDPELQSALNDITTKIEELIKTGELNIEGKSYKTLKDAVPELTQRLFGIVPKTGNLTKVDTRNAQMFINKHVDALIAMLPQGHTAGSTSTGVQQVLLKEFYNKRSVRAQTGPGLKVQFKKPIIDPTKFKEVFGITERGKLNLYKKQENTSSRIKALVTQTGKIITNQAVRQYQLKNNMEVDVALADGKSEYMFSKQQKVTEESVDQVIGIMQSNEYFVDKPGAAVRIASEVYNNPIENFGNLADVLESQIQEKVTDLTKEDYAELVDESITPELLEYDTNWDGFIKRKKHEQYSPWNKKEDKDRKLYIEQATSFLNTMPTEWLTNGTFEAIFANGTQGDFFYKVEEIRAITKEIIKQRKSNTNFKNPKGGNLVTKGLFFDSNLMKKIVDVSIKYEASPLTNEQKVKAISKEVKAIRDKSTTNPQDMRNGLEFVMNKLNSFINDPNIDNKTKIARGKFITTLLKDQTSKGSGIIRGGAMFEMLSVSVGKQHGKFVKGFLGKALTDVYGLSSSAVKLIGNPKASIKSKYRLKNESLSQTKARLENEINNKLKPIAENLGFTTQEYREMLQQAMINPKTHHGEHVIALLSMTTNSFDSMVDGTFNSKFPNIIKYYDQMALNEDFRVLIDQYFKTGMPADFFFGMNPFVRMTTIMPEIASDTIVLNKDTTMDRVIAGELALKKIEKGEFTPVTKVIKNSATPQQLGVINKNTNKIFKSPDLTSDFNNVISDAANVLFSKAPNKTSISVKNLVNNINNISNINSTKRSNETVSELVNKDMTLKQQREVINIVNNAILFSRKVNPSQGMSVWDFDDTLAKTKSKVLFTSPEGVTGSLTAEQYAKDYVELAEQGYEFDFSEFNKVVEGEIGPFFKKFVDRIKKFGVKDNYILTARPAESAPAIKEFLKSQGLDIPLENITGLANSTAEAKALWMAEKVSEGYNDIYFADDALANVQVVKNILDQMDVKSKVQQAKYLFSKQAPGTFDNILESNKQEELDLNKILEQTKNVKAEIRYSDVQAKIRGSKKRGWKLWIPPSAEDFKGLIYKFIGKGKQGEAHMSFFEKLLFKPYEKAYSEINSARQGVTNEFRELIKAYPDIRKKLNKKIPGTNFKTDHAIRVYIWNKHGMEIPGISKRDLKKLVDMVENDINLTSFADTLSIISRQEAGYIEPSEYWAVENIQSDLLKMVGEVGRETYLQEWKQNIETVFGTWENRRLVGPNMNKIEAIYGPDFRDALEDIVWRMEYGTSREQGKNKLVNAFNNWANQSVGAIMFFNMRSALLQTISSVNFINWSDNNPLKAAAAFANQKQYWKDFSYIFNSDMLKQRRKGQQRGINEAELAAAIAGSKNKAKAALNWLLTKGFLPTQIADSFAIASGGATMYRNRINKYIKDGLSQKEAESKAWQDFQAITEVSQQSSRPDLISQQQASPLGRYILAFKNTPMQYGRLIKKGYLDLINGRGDAKTNVSKILYYGVIQNALFAGLQTALFAAIASDDEEDFTNRFGRVTDSMLDSFLYGWGMSGTALATGLDVIQEFLKQEKKGWNADHTSTILRFFNFSPTIGSKGRKLYNAIQTYRFNKDIIAERGFTLDNPGWEIPANIISGIFNVPLDRLVSKMQNIDAALDSNNQMWQRIALVLGWKTYDFGIKDQDIIELKQEVKERKTIEKEKRKEEEKAKKDKEKELKIIKEEEEEQKLEEKLIQEDKQQEKKTYYCPNIRDGVRCKMVVDKAGDYCTYHEKVPQRKDGKKSRCAKIKSDGKQCGNTTANQSGLCYVHD
jgi:hypothetical protein